MLDKNSSEKEIEAEILKVKNEGIKTYTHISEQEKKYFVYHHRVRIVQICMDRYFLQQIKENEIINSGRAEMLALDYASAHGMEEKAVQHDILEICFNTLRGCFDPYGRKENIPSASVYLEKYGFGKEELEKIDASLNYASDMVPDFLSAAVRLSIPESRELFLENAGAAEDNPHLDEYAERLRKIAEKCSPEADIYDFKKAAAELLNAMYKNDREELHSRLDPAGNKASRKIFETESGMKWDKTAVDRWCSVPHGTEDVEKNGQPYIEILYSENETLAKKKILPLKEGNNLIGSIDAEMQAAKAARDRKYGSLDKFFEAEQSGRTMPDEKNWGCSYDKTGIKVVLGKNYGSPAPFAARMDIGDCGGGVFAWIRRNCRDVGFIEAADRAENDLYFPDVVSKNRIHVAVFSIKERFDPELAAGRKNIAAAEKAKKDNSSKWISDKKEYDAVTDNLEKAKAVTRAMYSALVLQAEKAAAEIDSSAADVNTPCGKFIMKEIRNLVTDCITEALRCGDLSPDTWKLEESAAEKAMNHETSEISSAPGLEKEKNNRKRQNEFDFGR